MQSGDVLTTFADISALKDETGFEPKIDLAEGISRWVNWYLATQNNK